MKSFIRKQIQKFEKHYQYDASYLHGMLDSSLSLVMAFSKFQKLSAFAKHADKDVLAIAKIAALKHEDCGPCLQLTIDMAIESGVEPKLLEMAAKQPEQLRSRHQLIYELAQSVCTSTTPKELVEQVKQHFGEAALAEIAVAIASARVYPNIKRAMGMTQQCKVIQVTKTNGAPKHAEQI